MGNTMKSLVKIQGLLSNLSWMMLAEIMSRLSRFITLFVLAANFTSAEYGTVMLALLCHEILRVFTRLGAGARIIQCADSELESICANAASLQWCVAIAVAILQITLANSLAVFYDNADLSDLLKTMAVAHIIYPIVTTKVFRLQRANRMRYFGTASGLCIAFENILVALLVYLDSSMHMIAYSKVAAGVFWVVVFLPSIKSNTQLSWDSVVMKDLMSFATKVLGSELVKAFRGQADSLFAARLLSPELFGIYSFAKSASVGISQSFSAAYLSALYPYLCQQLRQDNWVNGLRYTIYATLVVMGLFSLQGLVAPWYIELLFGERWAHATGMASAMCFVAIPILFADGISMIWRIQGKAGLELVYTLLCGSFLFCGLIAVQPQTGMAMTDLILLLSGSWIILGLSFLFKPHIVRWLSEAAKYYSPSKSFL